MSFVGFSALYMTLRRSGIALQLREVAQLNAIVLSGFMALFAALLVVQSSY